MLAVYPFHTSLHIIKKTRIKESCIPSVCSCCLSPYFLLGRMLSVGDLQSQRLSPREVRRCSQSPFSFFLTCDLHTFPIQTRENCCFQTSIEMSLYTWYKNSQVLASFGSQFCRESAKQACPSFSPCASGSEGWTPLQLRGTHVLWLSAIPQSCSLGGGGQRHLLAQHLLHFCLFPKPRAEPESRAWRPRLQTLLNSHAL